MLNSQIVHQRVCALLLQLAKPVGEDAATIDSLPQQKHLAIMVNTSRETVSRSLSLLIRRGFLQRHGKACLITSLSELRRQANEANS
jgi:DNA-binding GntR family transcriptional regulator